MPSSSTRASRRCRWRTPARCSAQAGGRSFSAASQPLAGSCLPAKLEVLFGDFLAHYNAHIADHTRLYPGVEAALDQFARDGWRQAVCTNKMEGSAKLLIETLGVADRFAFICGQDTFGVGKPDPKPLLGTIAASAGFTPAPSWSEIRSPTSRRLAPPACR